MQHEHELSISSNSHSRNLIKGNFETELMLLLFHAVLVQNVFEERLGIGVRDGRLFEGGHLLIFGAFRVGAYSRWTLIRINGTTIVHTFCFYVTQ